jgi:hypothetical protein
MAGSSARSTGGGTVDGVPEGDDQWARPYPRIGPVRFVSGGEAAVSTYGDLVAVDHTSEARRGRQIRWTS